MWMKYYRRSDIINLLILKESRLYMAYGVKLIFLILFKFRVFKRVEKKTIIRESHINYVYQVFLNLYSCFPMWITIFSQSVFQQCHKTENKITFDKYHSLSNFVKRHIYSVYFSKFRRLWILHLLHN